MRRFTNLVPLANALETTYRNKLSRVLKTKIQNELVRSFDLPTDGYSLEDHFSINTLEPTLFTPALVLAIFKRDPKLIDIANIPRVLLTSDAFEEVLNYYSQQVEQDERFLIYKVFSAVSEFPIESQTPLLVTFIRYTLHRIRDKYFLSKTSRAAYFSFLFSLQLPQEAPQDGWLPSRSFVPDYSGPYLQAIRKLGTDAMEELEGQAD
jgi:hypothetical protein